MTVFLQKVEIDQNESMKSRAKALLSSITYWLKTRRTIQTAAVEGSWTNRVCATKRYIGSESILTIS